MNLPFRLGLPAAASLVINGLLLGMLLYLGMGEIQQRKEGPALTIWSLAAPLGEDDGQNEQQAKARTSAKPKPPVTPQTPPPAAQSVSQPPPVALIALPTLVPQAIAPVSLDPSAMAEPMPAAAKPAPAASGPAQAQPRKGARDGFDSAAPPGNSRSYAAKVRSWLYAHKTYPKRSRMRREEGIVRVQFVLDRRGHLLEGRVIQGSGFTALDLEGREMLYRASPYPAAPREVPGDRIEFTAPIEFTLPT